MAKITTDRTQKPKKKHDIEPGVVIATAVVGVWVVIVLILLILGY